MPTLSFGDASLPDRYWSKVQPIPFPTWGTSGCWLWTGATTGKGYGSFNLGRSRSGRQRTGVAHKMTYEALHGRVRSLKRRGKRLVVDHLCRTRSCVNPDHHELVVEPINVRRGDSPAARNARKTHCPRGHAYTPENTYELRIISRGRSTTKRYCRACKRGDVRAIDAAPLPVARVVKSRRSA